MKEREPKKRKNKCYDSNAILISGSHVVLFVHGSKRLKNSVRIWVNRWRRKKECLWIGGAGPQVVRLFIVWTFA
jgi:hypothetical protein